MPDPISGVLAASSIIGAGANIFGAQSAADAQKEAAAKASQAVLDQQQKGFDTQKSYYDEGAGYLKPIAAAGRGVYDDLVSKLPDLTAPIVMDQKTLEATPGYQWTQAQGIRGIDLSAISKGLSGAQAKAAATYATGLADNTYKTQFDIANTNKTNAFNRLLQTAQVGTDASKYLANNATSAGNAALGNTATVGGQLSSNAIGAGNAQAAADISTGKNIGNAVSGVAGSYASAPSNNPFGNYGGAGMYGPNSSIDVGGTSYPAYR